jgi:hypothetical protein
MNSSGPPDWVFVVAMALSASVLIALIAIGLPMIAGVFKRRAVERTKRDVLAYVAEGTITPEHAERLLVACNSKGGRSTDEQLDLLGDHARQQHAGRSAEPGMGPGMNPGDPGARTRVEPRPAPASRV